MHKLLVASLVPALVSLVTFSAFAADATAPAVVKSNAGSASASDLLSAKLAAYNSLQGRFEQVLASKDGKVQQTTQGDFRFKKPGLYLWQSEEPYPQTVVGNGKTLWVYDPDLEQVTETAQSKMPFNPATLIAGGIDQLSRQYQIAHTVAGDTEIFNLAPQTTTDKQAAFSQLSLSFKGESLVGALLIDQLGQQTRIRFSAVTKNRPMADAQFTFVPPEGTDVLVND
ncbi:MAG: outer membrane lipoprotein chaperone LolA [Marinagarivorans sp.]|nr:outer membrane lipoprotein chaperone LolA [Marinagarivorans sp.]